MTQDLKPASKPSPVFPAVDQIPAELRSLHRWIGWRYKWNGHKWNKPPASPVDGSAIGATSQYSDHFLTFENAADGAIKNRLDGVGFVLCEDDGYCGIDFDNAVANGATCDEVAAWLRWLPSYTEYSPSGEGLHIICRGKLAKALTAAPLAKESEATVEIYTQSRFFTMTGQRVGGVTTIADCQTGINKLLQLVGNREPHAAGPGRSAAERPMSKRAACKIYADNLAALKAMTRPEDSQNAQLNTCAFFAARAFAAGALEGTEEQIKEELRATAAETGQCPGIEATLRSGWASGRAKPLPLRAVEPIITNPGHLAKMIRDSEQVLHGVGLKYFERNDELVTTSYGRDVPQVKDIERASDSVVILEASYETITRDLDTRATYAALSEGKGGVKERLCHVPKNLPSQIHDRVHTEPRDVPFPTLDMVTASPVLLPSGQLHGNDVFKEGVLYTPRDRNRFPTIADRPTRDDGRAALALFDDIFCMFPFVDPNKECAEWKQTASYSVVLAGVLSLVARPFLRLGAIPIISANAPSRRYGKTKIIEAISACALGHKPTVVHFVDEDELGKHLQPLMRAGDRAILIDNVERSLQSAKLCILITGGVLRDRVLGESRDVVLKNYAVLFATGNNLVIGGDLSARAVRADIDAGLERPEARHFTFDPVSRAVERHPQLVTAAVTALRAYVLAGKPWQLQRATWGGFERWDALVSGCLTWLGYADPCDTRERIIESDPIRTANVDILEEWFSRYNDQPVTLANIKKDEGTVYEALLKNNQWDGHHAQWILRRLESQVCNGYRLVRLTGRSRFKVELVGRQGAIPYESPAVSSIPF